ncbi:MAG: family 43 glycosylhydrolase [Verrucomicrobiota bacterium]
MLNSLSVNSLVLFTILAAAAFLNAGCMGVAPDVDSGRPPSSWSVIEPGKMIYDSRGNRMQCHSAGVIKVGDTYYLHGEDLSRYCMNAPYTFSNISCWSTKDFSNWTFESNVITHAQMVSWGKDGWVIARPHVIYNSKNHEYVMIAKFLKDDASDCRLACFASATPTGHFEFKHFMPCPDPADAGKYVGGDGTLFKDADGKVYFAGISIFNDFHVWIYQLDADYYNLVAGTKVDTGLEIEGIDFLKRNGTYYLIASSLSGYANNENVYYTATNITGPWLNKTYICNPATGTKTYESQHSKTVTVVGSEGTTYIFCSDAWANATNDAAFRVDSRLLFLPVEFNGTAITVNWRNQWKLDAAKGIWTAGNDSVWGKYLHSYCADKYGISTAYELGQQFVPTVAGQIKAISVYGVSGENGNHTARIWRNFDNTCVAGPYVLNFTGKDEWYDYPLPTPVRVGANTEYTISVTTGADANKLFAFQGVLATFASTNGYDPNTGNPGYWRFSNQRSKHLTFPQRSGVVTTEIGSKPTTHAGNIYYRDIEFAPD